MSFGADALRRLVALDLPVEAFKEVLSIFADMQAKDEERRAKQRERTQAARGRKRDGNVTVTAETRDSLVTTEIEKKDPSDSPKENQELPQKKTPPMGGQKKKGFALPGSWTPSEEAQQAGREVGLSDQQLASELDRFRDWAAANAHREVGRKLDWNAAFRNWLRTAAERIFERTHPPPKPDRTAQSLDRLQQKFDDEKRRNGTLPEDLGPVIDHEPQERSRGH